MSLNRVLCVAGPLASDCKLFFVGGEQVGLIRPDIWRELSLVAGGVFQFEPAHNAVTLNPDWRSYEERSERMDALLVELRARDAFPTLRGWRNEVDPPHWATPLFAVYIV